MQNEQTTTAIMVRPSAHFGWRWNVGHECSYICGAGGCDGAGWRLTRRAAVRSARRYHRRQERYKRRLAHGWETVDNGRTGDT